MADMPANGSAGSAMAVRILVTGAEGQLARALGERAAARSDIDLIYARRPAFDLEKIETIEPVIRAARPDVVVAAAAYTAVDLAEDEPGRAMRINGDGAGHLAAAARAASAELIHISTDYVYYGGKPTPYVETDPVAPQNAYGRSKLAGELTVRAAHPDAVIIRTAWVYSPFGRNFVKTMLDLARTRDKLAVVDDQRGNPTSAHDIADAILAMVARWQASPTTAAGELYHCAGTGEATWCDVARHVFAASKARGGPFAEVIPIASDDWPTKAVRPANSRLDCAKLAVDFGWQSPAWQLSVDGVVQRLLEMQTASNDRDAP